MRHDGGEGDGSAPSYKASRALWLAAALVCLAPGCGGGSDATERDAGSSDAASDELGALDGGTATDSGPPEDLGGTWRECLDEGDTPQVACAATDSEALFVFGDDDVTSVSTDTGECERIALIADGETVLLRGCGPREWFEDPVNIHDDGQFLTMAYDNGAQFFAADETPATVALALCATTQDHRCMTPLPVFDATVDPTVVGVWRSCGPASSEPSSAVACASPSGSAYLVVNADGTAQRGCDLVDLVATSSSYAIRYCGALFASALEGRWGELVRSSGSGSEEYLRIEDPNGSGYVHHIRVPMGDASLACSGTVEDLRCTP